jgi:hypothetical protein
MGILGPMPFWQESTRLDDGYRLKKALSIEFQMICVGFFFLCLFGMALAIEESKVFRKAYSRENGIVGGMSSLQLVGRARHQDNNRKQLNAFKLGRASEQREMEQWLKRKSLESTWAPPTAL